MLIIKLQVDWCGCQEYPVLFILARLVIVIAASSDSPAVHHLVVVSFRWFGFLPRPSYLMSFLIGGVLSWIKSTATATTGDFLYRVEKLVVLVEIRLLEVIAWTIYTGRLRRVLLLICALSLLAWWVPCWSQVMLIHCIFVMRGINCVGLQRSVV